MFKDILLHTNCGWSKIRSVHKYVLKRFILVVSTVHKQGHAKSNKAKHGQGHEKQQDHTRPH